MNKKLYDISQQYRTGALLNESEFLAFNARWIGNTKHTGWCYSSLFVQSLKQERDKHGKKNGSIIMLTPL